MYTYKKANPLLRFPEFVDDWRLVDLGSLFRERIEFTKEDLPLWSLTIERGVVPKTERYERSFLVQSEDEAYKVMCRDDFAFNPMNLRFGALGRLKTSDRVLVSQYYNVFSCNEFADPVFVENYLTTHNLLQFYNKMATGTLDEKKRVHYSQFIEFRLPFPELAEQQKIAAFLLAVDNKILQLARKKELLFKYKKGVMQQIFDQEIRFKDENGNDFPDWAEKEVIEIAPLQRGFDLPVDKIVEGEFPVVFSNGILKTHNETKAKAPGVVTGRSGTLGKVTYVEKDYWPHNTSLWVTDFRGNDSKFIFYFYVNLKLERLGTGSGVPTLNRNDVHVQRVSIPEAPEQMKIADFLSALDEKINLVNQQLEKTKTFKKGLLQQMFV